MKIHLTSIIILISLAAYAQLEVAVFPIKIAGQKAVVPLTMTNNLNETVESARAICFLLDDQGKVLGQSSEWVIGGLKSHSDLRPKDGVSFNFIVTSSQPFTTTNLTTKVSFSRIVFEGGRAADVAKSVNVVTSP
jgi:hypothetical protein